MCWAGGPFKPRLLWVSVEVPRGHPRGPGPSADAESYLGQNICESVLVFSAAVFPSLTLSQPKQLYQESESKLPFSLSSIPRKESFLRMKLCLQIFARGIVAAHIIFFSLWNRKVREAHSLLLFAALPEASLEAASWLDPGTTVSHNISVFQKHRTEVLCVWALCSYPKSPCVIYKCLPSL